MAKQNCVNSSLTAHGIQVADAAGVGCTSTTLNNGQLLIGSTGAAPVAATLSAGTGISITPGAGTLTITNTGGGGGGVVSITGINGLDATDTGGGAYEVGVAAINFQPTCIGSCGINLGDGTDSGSFNILANAGPAAPNPGDGCVSLVANGGYTGQTGIITLQTFSDGTANQSQIVMYADGQDAANTGIVVVAARQPVSSASPATVTIGSGLDSGIPSDCKMEFIRTGDGITNTAEIACGDLTTNTGNSFHNVALNFAVTSTAATQTHQYICGQDGSDIGHIFKVDPIGTFYVTDGTNKVLWRNGEQLVTEQAFIIDWNALPSPYPEPALTISGSDQIGDTTLFNGTVTVTIPWVTSGMRVFATCRQVIGTPGFLEAVAGTGDITINSYDTAGVLNTADASQVNYWVMP